MNSAAAIPARMKRLKLPLLAAWRDWLNTDAPVLIYLSKVLLASLLAMWLSLRFELDQPRTAMLTVAIVMQSRSGMVFSKSYYRLLGTLVGVLVTFVLVAFFAQQRIWFLACMGIWIGLCTAGSMIYRNHLSYAFVLAGYTLCIVGLPPAASPELTFDIGITRISEIMIGLFCATLVSDLVFPQRMWDVMLNAVRRRFRDFSDLLRTTAQAPAGTEASTPTLLRFIGDIFNLESFRASAALENDDSRRHRQRLSRMNNEFMEVSTSFHAFGQWLRRQARSGNPQIGDALLARYRQLGDALSIADRSARTEQEALVVARQLAAFQQDLAASIAAARLHRTQALDDTGRLDFETGAELLQRMTVELHAYAATYAALASEPARDPLPAFDSPPKLEMHFDPLAVSLAGLRGALTLAVMSALWILTDWNAGIEAITIGVVTSTLFATSPAPTRTIRQFLAGAVIGALLAYLCNFHWLTQAQGFGMLALAVSPCILLAAWLTTRPAVAVVGAGTFIVFLMHIGFNSVYSANPEGFINDVIADLLAVLVSGAMYGLIDISSSAWSRRRIANALRNLVVSACREPLALRRTRLEAAARDLVQRAGSPQRIGEAEDRVVIEWLLSTLEIGHAVIALREHLQAIHDHSLSASLRASLEAIAELHASPSRAGRLAAVAAVEGTAAMLTRNAAQPGMPPSVRRQLPTMLHFIRSALQDDTSVLALQENR